MFEFWLENNKDITAVANYLKSKISHKVDDVLNKLLCAKARNINNYIRLKWHNHARSAKVFMEYEKEWLAREIVFVIPRQTNKIGRPKSNYDESKERNKRKMAFKLASWLAENASEARNKFYKKDRSGHARQDVIALNILDMYHRAMDSSDPYISSKCLTERTNKSKKLPFSQEVIGLFKMPELPPQFKLPSTSQQACASNYDSDISDDSVESLANYSIELEAEENEGTDYGILSSTSPNAIYMYGHS